MKLLGRALSALWAGVCCLPIAGQVEYAQANHSTPLAEKEWTFLIYMSADNDLYQFAWRNLAQAAEIGSNQNLNVVVHLDIKTPGKPKVTKRLYLEKNKVLQVEPDACMDSGAEETLTSAALWALKKYPSRHFALVFWNHGFGDLNPVLKRIANPAHLFHYNTRTGLIELDRSIPFMEYNQLVTEQSHKEECQRGICFDETNYNYLDDNKLIRSFKRIREERNGENIDFVIFDACLMAMTGTAALCRIFSNWMVASQEVVLGPGYNYNLTLRPFAEGQTDCAEISKQIVAGYYATYGKLTEDYTQSAINLAYFDLINQNIDLVAQLLIEGLQHQKKQSVKALIRSCRNRHLCTYFDEPSYIDLFDFYSNLLKRLNSVQLEDAIATEDYMIRLANTLVNGLELAKDLVAANICGKNLARARGISIYFPEYRINNVHHNSYQYTYFAQSNHWPDFLRAYLN
ncbi:MAG: Peptidase C11 clostripain [candidate division TM6 bacterium GW2011_GWF2_43_17]|nr:MAG: Peptidase C11 clostripain [candidate division TM6 bacterium GW2011_GWF2_43_17]